MYERPPETSERVIAALGYASVLVVVPLALARHMPFVRHHARQGLVLLGVSLAAGWVPGWGWYLVSPIVAVLAIAGIVQALCGLSDRMPGIGDVAELIHV